MRRPLGSPLLLPTLACILGCAGPQPSTVQPSGIAQLTLPTSAAALQQTAATEETAGGIAERRALLGGISRQLLMAPPDDVFVPELFDFVTVMAPRMETGTISPAWASYLYTTYQRDLLAERPGGVPRRSTSEITVVLDGWVEHYHIQGNPRPGAQPNVRDAEFEALRQYRNDRLLDR
jgi:hypothetical protein